MTHIFEHLGRFFPQQTLCCLLLAHLGNSPDYISHYGIHWANISPAIWGKHFNFGIAVWEYSFYFGVESKQRASSFQLCKRFWECSISFNCGHECILIELKLSHIVSSPKWQWRGSSINKSDFPDRIDHLLFCLHFSAVEFGTFSCNHTDYYHHQALIPPLILISLGAIWLWDIPQFIAIINYGSRGSVLAIVIVIVNSLHHKLTLMLLLLTVWVYSL